MAKTRTRDDEDGGTKTKRAEPVKRDGAYVMMLFITLVAVAAGCVLLYLDHDEYGGKSPPKEAAPTVRKLGEELKAEPVAPPVTPPDGKGGTVTPPDGKGDGKTDGMGMP